MPKQHDFNRHVTLVANAGLATHECVTTTYKIKTFHRGIQVVNEEKEEWRLMHAIPLM